MDSMFINESGWIKLKVKFELHGAKCAIIQLGRIVFATRNNLIVFRCRYKN